MVARLPAPVVYQRSYGSAIPWNDGHPLVFHTMTRLGTEPGATAFFRDLLARDAALQPSARHTEDWTLGEVGDLKEIDMAAGDEEWLFFRPFSVYDDDKMGDDGEQVIAVAFDQETLFRSGPVGWRPHDLLLEYERIAEESDEGEDDPSIGILARWATITQPSLVDALIACGARTERAWMDADEDAAGQAIVAARQILSRKIGHRPRGVPGKVVRHIDWLAPFKAEPGEPHRYPEVLCGGALPLRSARFWRDGRGAWHPLRGDILR
jgi:hypothetical protein